MTRVTQDDSRENEQIKMFGLTPTQGRTNKYIPDGTITVKGNTYSIELKTGDVRRKLVSTARNVTLKKIKEWKLVWWILSEYEKIPEGFRFTGEHYFMSKEQLDPWYKKQEKKILVGTDFYGGLTDWYSVTNVLRENNVSDSTINRLTNSFMNRGCGLNDPRISWKYVESHGIKIDNSNPQQHLTDLLLKHS